MLIVHKKLKFRSNPSQLELFMMMVYDNYDGNGDVMMKRMGSMMGFGMLLESRILGFGNFLYTPNSQLTGMSDKDMFIEQDVHMMTKIERFWTSLLC